MIQCYSYRYMHVIVQFDQIFKISSNSHILLDLVQNSVSFYISSRVLKVAKVSNAYLKYCAFGSFILRSASHCFSGFTIWLIYTYYLCSDDKSPLTFKNFFRRADSPSMFQHHTVLNALPKYSNLNQQAHLFLQQSSAI